MDENRDEDTNVDSTMFNDMYLRSDRSNADQFYDEIK